MRHPRTIIYRGLPLAVLVFMCACSAPPAKESHEPRSLAAAVAALRVGDLPALREQQGKGAGLAQRANDLAQNLDPQAWLVAMGASGREHDLPAAAAAMVAKDDTALAEALGFSDQQLLADILSGGGSIYTRRADGRGYYETGPQPVDLLDGFSAPGLPQGCIAIELTLWGTRQERRFKVSIGMDTGGVTNLQAAADLARDTIELPARASRYADPQQALEGRMRELPLHSLTDPRWNAASITLLHADATIERAELGRDTAGWAVIESSEETQERRLSSIRDERLEFLRRAANDFERVSGRWPRSLKEITVKPWQLVDPTAPEGRQGWADHDRKPKAGIELSALPEQYAAIATHQTQKGRRAIAKDGKLTWVR